MTLTVAFQMDHIRSLKIAGDTGFALLLEAQRRGHRVLHYTPDRLSLRDGAVIAMAEPIEARDVEGDHFTLGTPERVDLSGVDAVLMRQDPPFDLAYITATHFLERIHPKTLVVNDPTDLFPNPMTGVFELGDLTWDSLIAGSLQLTGCNYTDSNGPPERTCDPFTVATTVPEPGTGALVGFALAALGIARRRR